MRRRAGSGRGPARCAVAMRGPSRWRRRSPGGGPCRGRRARTAGRARCGARWTGRLAGRAARARRRAATSSASAASSRPWISASRWRGSKASADRSSSSRRAGSVRSARRAAHRRSGGSNRTRWRTSVSSSTVWVSLVPVSRSTASHCGDSHVSGTTISCCVRQAPPRQLVEVGVGEQPAVLDRDDELRRDAVPAPARAQQQRDERRRQLAAAVDVGEQLDGLGVPRARSPAAARREQLPAQLVGVVDRGKLLERLVVVPQQHGRPA